MKNKYGIQCFYGSSGVRAVVFSDIIAVLYERGLNDLAKELSERGEKAFDELDKSRTQTWTAVASPEADKILEKLSKKKWWQR